MNTATAKCKECQAKADCIAPILYRTAKRDVSANGNGRLIITDLQKELEDPTLTADKIISIWRTHFQNTTIRETITANVLLVEFEGREFAPIFFLQAGF